MPGVPCLNKAVLTRDTQQDMPQTSDIASGSSEESAVRNVPLLGDMQFTYFCIFLHSPPHIFQGWPIVFCVEGWSTVKIQLGLGRRPVMCLCVSCVTDSSAMLSPFFLNMESLDFPAREDYLSTSSNETKKRNCVERGKGQGGVNANYCTLITP